MEKERYRSFAVLLGWLVVEVIVLLVGAGRDDRTGTGFVLMVVGLPLLLGQLVVGALLTVGLNRRRFGAFAAGTLGFLPTAVVALMVILAIYNQ